MPSRADRFASGALRIRLERAAHALAVVAIGWLLVQALRGGAVARGDTANVQALPAQLVRWTRVAAPAWVHVRVDGALTPAQRDWLAALRGVGTAVSWEGVGLDPLAAVADPVADPAGGTRVLVAAPPGRRVVLADHLGVLDSVRAGAAGARFLVRSGPAAVRVQVGPLLARSAVRDSLVLGRLLVLGRVGWESKFVIAALEERGWRVDARLVLSPSGDVVQGTTSPLDTARYAAVIVLDTAGLAGAPRLARYVQSGGGLVVGARTAMAPALAPLVAGAAQATLPAVEPFDTTLAEPRRALALTPIRLAADAVPIERRDALVAVAARRVGSGRTVTVGYADTWRWRMGGGAGALEEHRSWWAGLVAGVAHAGRIPRPLDAPLDEAPFVHLIERLGPPSPERSPRHSATDLAIAPRWVFAVFGVALLLEWLSRRLRGAP
jgi:hypothetical protein